MTELKYLFLYFPLAITLHNIEEAIWLPQWSFYAKKYHRPVNKDEFRFAVLLITALAYISTFLIMTFSNIDLFKYFYFGFLGAMIMNTFFPHLVATILLKRYAPGLATGILLLIPINTLIIYLAVKDGFINLDDVILSSLIVGILLLGSLPFLFKLGAKLINY
ncbi:HXXEE domain-containing protein [Vallitalea okinawensis]|uniref:HXXEE domain-containing protein n=1 Tax=Vallitalea okinawensis TaxID=2078660 RepID=UPI000CFC792A|nr:HXXEE domain-containing protein [Vallitalea okinawensis]